MGSRAGRCSSAFESNNGYQLNTELSGTRTPSPNLLALSYVVVGGRLLLLQEHRLGAGVGLRSMWNWCFWPGDPLSAAFMASEQLRSQNLEGIRPHALSSHT